MSEFRQRTVETRPNYDNTREEPVVLPAEFPNLLVNGCSGIAVGLATNIPPHNLGDVIKACVHLVDHSDASTAELLDRIKGPDFPLGGKIITDRKTLRHIYEDGSGSIKIQGEWKLEHRNKKDFLVITSIPYGVDKGKLEQDMGAIIAERKLPQVFSLANESNEKDGLRIVMEVKVDADPDMIMAYFYKHTALQQTYSYNLTCLVPEADGSLRPERIGLKEMLRYFLDFRFATVKRRFEFDLEQLRRRIHILQGFKIIFDALDKAIKMIRESEGKQDAAEKLMKAFKLDEDQTNAILEAQLYKIAQMEVRRILDELREKKKEAERIEEILASKKKLWGVVKDEMNALSEKYADKRRTRMATDEDVLEFDEEAYIVRENTNVVLTRDGWIKRVGQLASLEKTRTREGDEIIAVAPGNTLDNVAFFADDGTAYTMRINEVPASSGYGEPITKFFKLDDNVKMVAAITCDERFIPPNQKPKNGDAPGPHVFVATSDGQVLRTPFAAFRIGSTKAGRRYVRLNEGERVKLVKVAQGETSVMLATANGRMVHFALEEVNILSGVGKGVMGIKLEEGDTCLGGALLGEDLKALTVEVSNGETKSLSARSYNVTSRAGKGHEIVKRLSFIRVVAPPISMVNWEEFEAANDNGENGAKHSRRNGSGKSLFE
jgi:DNA gyrase subunit A